MHTLTKFITAIGDMNFETLKNTCQKMGKIRGRSMNFAVIMEEQNNAELLFASIPQQNASEMLSLIDISILESEPITNYDNLSSFMLYLKEFAEERHHRKMTINKIFFYFFNYNIKIKVLDSFKNKLLDSNLHFNSHLLFYMSFLSPPKKAKYELAQKEQCSIIKSYLWNET